MKKSEMTAQEYAKHRVEMTRRELMALLAMVEVGTETGRKLQEILERAIDEVEALADEETVNQLD